jgi:hypothetical protein
MTKMVKITAIHFKVFRIFVSEPFCSVVNC